MLLGFIVSYLIIGNRSSIRMLMEDEKHTLGVMSVL